jgi:hypothetical protein
MPMPTTEDWLRNSEEYEELGFPHAIGCLDGKHFACEVRMISLKLNTQPTFQKPPHSGSLYYNYKGFFSVVMLALCDARRRFVIVDIGAAGRQSDSGIYASSGVCSPFAEILCKTFGFYLLFTFFFDF